MRLGGCWRICRAGNAQYWCCGSMRICRTTRSPQYWSVRRAPCVPTPPVGWRRCGKASPARMRSCEMTKPTDEEIGTLLRETFADKENLVDQLPEGTKHRRMPVLLAAAAVLVILGGILYAAGSGDPSPPPAAQATVTVPTAQTQAADSLIWAAGIEGIVKRESGTKPIVLYVLDAPHQGAGDPVGGPVRGTPFTAAERVGIENALAGVARIEWIR